MGELCPPSPAGRRTGTPGGSFVVGAWGRRPRARIPRPVWPAGPCWGQSAGVPEPPRHRRSPGSGPGDRRQSGAGWRAEPESFTPPNDV